MEKVIGGNEEAVNDGLSVRLSFLTKRDLESKLLEFQDYFNTHRTHQSLKGRTPDQDETKPRPVANLHCYRWQRHCRGLYQTPIAA